MNFFTGENENLHEEEEQLRRQKSALKLKLDSIDKENQRGIIKNYDIYLDSCACMDFAMHQKPCKHMYRLAHELGIIQLDSEKTKKVRATYTKEGEEERKIFKEKISQLSESAQKILQQIVSLHERYFPIDIKSDIEELERKNFVIIREIKFLDIAYRFTIADILEKCTNEKPSKKNRREPVMNFFAEHYPKEAAELVNEMYGYNNMIVDLTEETKKNIVIAQRYLASLFGRVERQVIIF